MTIYDYDTATAGHDGGSPERGHSTHAVVDRLSVGEPYAVVFGGQGGAWLENLEELVSSAGIESELNEIVGESELLLEPLARELVVVRPIGFEPMRWVRALGAEEPLPATKQLPSAAISFPGILLTQMAAIRALTRQGLDLRGTPPVAMAGHSQGVLGVESLKAGGARDAELLVMAQLIGAAGSLVSRRRGMVVRGGKSPMVSVTNADPDRIAELLDEFAKDVRTVVPPVLSIRNGRRSVVITGTPEQLSRFELYCQQITQKEEAERKNKQRGGNVFRPVFQAVQVEVGFHTPRLADGVELVDRWAEKVGIDTELSHDMAEAIFVRPVDWVSEVERLCEADAKWILDFGPSDTATRLTAPVIRGLGIGIVAAGTRGGQRSLFTVGATPEVQPPYSSYAPTLVELPDGSVKLSTKFTRLTGRSPILLAGMTPTTVDAKIVAAAANAGHWAELAGGGQVTEEIFEDRIAELTGLLEPGRAVQFNTLFLDPYLWKLQVGGKRLVQRARQSGAPIDGVVVSAGIPDLDGCRRADRRTQQCGHQPCGVQARNGRPDQIGDQDRRRGARQGRDRAHRGRPRGWAPLLGRPRRSAAEHVCGAAQAVQHHGLCRRRDRHSGAGGRVPVGPLGDGLWIPGDAGGRHPGRHCGDGDPGGDHVACGQADAGRDRRHRQVDQRRKSPGRHGFQP